MKSKILLGAVAAVLLIIGGVVAVNVSKSSSDADAESAAAWLSDQLEGGVVNAVFEGKASADYGLTADVLLALTTLDAQADDRDAILAALATNVDTYIGSGAESYAGATGKLATVVAVAGRDPASFGGQDLIKKAEARVVADGKEAGRATDASSFGDYSNTIGQSWVVRGLAGGAATSDSVESATAYLLRQQCANGAFRSNMFTVAAAAVEDDPATDWDDATPAVLPVDPRCGDSATPDDDALTIDATALGIQALQAASKSGVDGLRGDIDQAVDWLLEQQRDDGSFLNDDAANTNTTGLAAATLRAVGEDGAADDAAEWIGTHQVDDELAETDSLSRERGAIAFDRSALKQGETAGITDATRDQWVRATAQAAVGVLAE